MKKKLERLDGSFLYRVYKRVRPTTRGCFEYFGPRNHDGYGRTQGDNTRKLVFVHRELWQRFKGPLEKGQCVCHHCDNPCCVNLNHMFVGTHLDNMADRQRKGRHKAHPGSKNGCAILTETDIPIIRERIKKGDTCYGIARQYGVSGETILAIKHGRTWKHVA